ncbi:MAG: Holliday junction resolvase RuvX [Alicyclobacillaceae bacterium]|nr:Holliday junction resolvase RuvX [Alicyclobacillaceae bacterium]
MRALGVDYGERRIGLAVSDPTGLVAQSLSVIGRTSDEASAEAIGDLAVQLDVDTIVVGLPCNMNGSLGPAAERCQAFARLLEARTGLKVVLYDERLTTSIAERMLVAADVSRGKRKRVVDAVAAALMLQGYLDSRQRSGPPPAPNAAAAGAAPEAAGDTNGVPAADRVAKVLADEAAQGDERGDG